MLLNVSQLLMDASGSVRECQMDEQIGLLDSSRKDLVSGEVRLLKTTRSIWVSATLESDVVNQCDRCLAPFSQTVHMDIEEEYFLLSTLPQATERNPKTLTKTPFI